GDADRIDGHIETWRGFDSNDASFFGTFGCHLCEGFAHDTAQITVFVLDLEFSETKPSQIEKFVEKHLQATGSSDGRTHDLLRLHHEIVFRRGLEESIEDLELKMDRREGGLQLMGRYGQEFVAVFERLFRFAVEALILFREVFQLQSAFGDPSLECRVI